MGIFNKSDPKTSANPTGPVQVNLPQNILSSLNLTPQDIEAYHSGIIEKESTEAGSEYYKENANNITQAPPIKLGEIALSPKVQDKSDLVPSIYTQMDGMESAMESTLKPDSLKLIKSHLKAFSTGYAQAALAANDWQTAIKSFDKATDGGIVQNAEAIATLGNAFKDNLEIRVKIAELIQELVNKRSQSPNQEPPKAPATRPPMAEPSGNAGQATPAVLADTKSATEPAPAPPAPQPIPNPNPSPEPAPVANLKPQNPNDIPLTPKINLAQGKPAVPITTPDGLVLRPVPTPNPNQAS